MSEASDWRLIQNLAMLVRRLYRRLERDMRNGYIDQANGAVVQQAIGFLAKHGLQGSLLRSKAVPKQESEERK